MSVYTLMCALLLSCSFAECFGLILSTALALLIFIFSSLAALQRDET